MQRLVFSYRLFCKRARFEQLVLKTTYPTLITYPFHVNILSHVEYTFNVGLNLYWKHDMLNVNSYQFPGSGGSEYSKFSVSFTPGYLETKMNILLVC